MHVADNGRISPAHVHDHRFLGEDHVRNQRRTIAVVAVTAVMMVIEIVAGWAFGSMALTADGWHMATHAGAIGLAALAYRFASAHAADPRFAFGAGKVGDLAGFASAIILGIVALGIGYESLLRLSSPQPVAYLEASAVAVVGLAVNVVCALLLGHGHGHSQGHGHSHPHGHNHGSASGPADASDSHGHDHDERHHHGRPHGLEHGEADKRHADHNMRGAYLHVLADALTSVLAIAGLLAGWSFGWSWVDPAIGVVGAVVIATWSIGLARDSARVLVDATPDDALAAAIRDRLEIGDVRVSDLHLWRVGPGHMAAIVALVTHRPEEPADYKARLAGLDALSHVTVEVNLCREPPRVAA